MNSLATTEDRPTQKRVDMAEELRRRVSPRTIIRPNEPLARRTTLRVGGPADLYLEPVSTEELGAVIRFCSEQNLRLLLLGRGSNLLIKDGGFRGVVICLSQPQFGLIEVAGEHLSCGAGARLKAVAVEAKRRGLAGLEFLEGIPGSVGGALRMNAGAMGEEIFKVMVSIRLMDEHGRVEERTRPEMDVQYRSCPMLKTRIALGAVLRGHTDDPQLIAQRMDAFSRKRWDSQPAAPSAGCIFKNPSTIPAGKLVDELGLKGTRVGGAFVSAEHGNFIVNDGTARAQDVLELIELIRSRARAQRGIDLETEVEIVGD